METLPEEMVEAVAVYLTLQDLAACCLVSQGWREVFNRDNVWRHHSACNPARARHLCETPNVVEPHIQLPEITETILTPVCEERENLLREKHLWSNWREGRFEKSVILNPAFVADRISFLTNVHLVLLSKNKITVWNVHDDSNNGFFEPVKLPSDREIGLCKMVGDEKVVIVQESMVYVFLWDLSSTHWSFLCAFSFNDSTNKFFRRLERVKLPREEIKFCSFDIFGNIFFGWLQDQKTIHIWDIQCCNKLKEQALPTSNNFYIKDFKQSETEEKKILVATIHLEEDFYPMILCYVYDLKKLAFLPFKAVVHCKSTSVCNRAILNAILTTSNCDGVFIFYGKYVSVTYRRELHIFDVEAVQCAPITIIKVHSVPQVFNENFIFYSSNTIRAYDPCRKTFITVIDKIAVPRNILNIGDKFCIAYYCRSNSLFCEVWEISKNLEASEAKTKLFYWNPGTMLLNKACTVLLSVSKLEGRLCKLCFW